MPTIESKKYGHTQYITPEAWERFKELGKDRNFVIIDDSDIKETVIPAPENIVDFAKAQDVTMPLNETVEPIMDRDELKAWLTEHNVDFNPRTSTDKLKELYKNWSNG